MKKALMVLGGIFAGLLVVGVIGVAVVAVKGNALDKESRQYVDAAVPAIVSTWEITEIRNRASPEFNAAVNDADLETLIRKFRTLGRLKAYKGARGQANMSVASRDGKVISAAYTADAEFDTGPAEVNLSLIKHGDQWQLLGIRINSRLFLEQ